jgi:tetratricopeptide (TPR) repeat protein
VKRHVLALLVATTFLPAVAAAQTAPAPAAAKPAQAGAKPGQAVNPVTSELAQRAIAAAQKDNYEEALKLFRQAYRTDKNPRWLYDMGVIYDRMAVCDDAAFFYRAGLYGKGVLPQDVDLVDNRLGVLQDECNFKEKHKQVADRHDRAARYMSLKLCELAADILTGIITPAERQQVEACKAEAAKEK